MNMHLGINVLLDFTFHHIWKVQIFLYSLVFFTVFIRFY